MPESTAERTAVATPASGFDEQARHYDVRAGLPAHVGGAVARAVVNLTGAHADDLVVELGAGTGEIGIHLARLPIRYVGLDASAAMLEVYRAKAIEPLPMLLVADCNRRWPLSDSSTAVVFASRVMHLLDADHAVAETIRVCRPKGLLLLGRVVRERDSITEQLRRKRRELLAATGIAARQGEEGAKRVIEGCIALGGESLGRQIVAEWNFETTAGNVIEDWTSLARWGSVVVDGASREAMVAELRAWAQITFSDLNRRHVSAARYAIDVVRLP